MVGFGAAGSGALLPPRPSLRPTPLLLLPSSRNVLNTYTARTPTSLLVVNMTRMMRLARPTVVHIALNRRPRATAQRRTAAIPSKWKAARLEAAYQDAQREYQEQQGYEGQQGYDQNAYATYDQQQQGGFYNQNTYAQGYNRQAYAQQGYDQTQYDYSYQ